MGRRRIHLTSADKQRAYRVRQKLKRNGLALRNSNGHAANGTRRAELILELFPGAGLFGKAFEQLGFCVVRGPDILWGGDIRDFHAPAGRFDGIIGGPPCQPFSQAAITGTDAIDLIPEFMRIVAEAQPKWAVMENVLGAQKSMNRYGWHWPKTVLRDWDCGGHTFRKRAFWFYGVSPAPRSAIRPGRPHYSVLATSWAHPNSYLLGKSRGLNAITAADLQGFSGLGERIVKAQPGGYQSNGKRRGVSEKSAHVLAVHLLGNGVPAAMGLHVARHILNCLTGKPIWADLPLFGGVI